MTGLNPQPNTKNGTGGSSTERGRATRPLAPWEEVLRLVLAGSDNREPELIVWMDQEPSASGDSEGAPWLEEAFSGFPVRNAYDRYSTLNAIVESATRGPVVLAHGFSRNQGIGSEIDGFLQDLVALELPPSFTLVMISPGGFATNTSRSRARELLMNRFGLKCVIFGNRISHQINPDYTIACLVFGPKDEQSFTYMIQLPRKLPDKSDLLDDLEELMGGTSGSSLFGYVLSAQLDEGQSLAFDLYNPDLKSRIDNLERLGSVQRLDELFTISSGGVPFSFSASLETRSRLYKFGEREKGMRRVIDSRDVHPHSGFVPESEASQYAFPSEGYLPLQKDDIMVPRVRMSSATSLRIGQVKSISHGELAGPSMFVLRAKRDFTEGQMSAVLIYLRSDLAARSLSAGRVNFHQVTRSTLAALPIPVADEDLSAAIDELETARGKLLGWTNQADSILGSLYLQKDSVAARRELLETSRTLRRRVEAGVLLDDPRELFRSAYPYPIASRWRRVEASYSGHDKLQAYKDIFQATEVLMVYSAALGMVLARLQGLEIPSLQGIRTKLAKGIGMSFGDWVSILDEVTNSKPFRALPDDVPLAEVQEILRSNGVTEARARINARRNDESHLRSLTGADLLIALQESYEDFKFLMLAAAPLTDLKLCHVVHAQADTLRGNTKVTYRELMGDHAEVSHRLIETTDMTIESDSLYIRDSRDRWHLLRPFLVGHECPLCRSWSTFHLDMVRRGTPVIKSLEHGHPQDAPDMLDDLALVGLLNTL